MVQPLHSLKVNRKQHSTAIKEPCVVLILSDQTSYLVQGVITCSISTQHKMV